MVCSTSIYEIWPTFKRHDVSKLDATFILLSLGTYIYKNINVTYIIIHILYIKIMYIHKIIYIIYHKKYLILINIIRR